jgi:hypothetical protein
MECVRAVRDDYLHPFTTPPNRWAAVSVMMHNLREVAAYSFHLPHHRDKLNPDAVTAALAYGQGLQAIIRRSLPVTGHYYNERLREFRRAWEQEPLLKPAFANAGRPDNSRIRALERALTPAAERIQKSGLRIVSRRTGDPAP